MKYILGIIFALALAGVGWWYLHEKSAAAADVADAQQTEAVERRDIEKLVSANGAVASRRDVDIKCQASGQIQTLPYTDISAEVPAGALVCELDPKDERPLCDNAQAIVDADKAKLQEAQDNWNISKLQLETTRSRDNAALAAAQARAQEGHAKAARTQELFTSKLDSKEDLETDQTAAAQADADVDTAKAAIEELKQAEIGISVKEQMMHEAESSLREDTTKLKTALLNLSYCKVQAPELKTEQDKTDPPRWFISSMLLNISPGYIVQSGTSGFSAGTTIMTLSDLSHIFVLASVDESDIGHVNDPERGQTAQDVRITVEAYPNEEFEGHVVRVAPKGVNLSNVVTFEVKIEVTSPNRMLLRPAMTATAKIISASRPGVLSIPVAAFMHTPAEADAATPSAGTQGAGTSPSSEGTATAASRPSHGKHGRKRGAVAQGVEDNALATEEGTVTVVKAGGASETRDVTVGISGDNYYEVVSGLSEGEDVVINKADADSKWKGKRPGGFLPRGVGRSR